MSCKSGNPKKIMMSLSRDEFKRGCIENRDNLREYIDSLTEEGYHTFESGGLEQFDMVSGNALINGLGESNCGKPVSLDYETFVHKPGLNSVMLRGGEYHLDEDGKRVYHDSGYYGIFPLLGEGQNSGYLRGDGVKLTGTDISGLSNAVTYDGKDTEHTEIGMYIGTGTKEDPFKEIGKDINLANFYTAEYIDDNLVVPILEEISDINEHLDSHDQSISKAEVDIANLQTGKQDKLSDEQIKNINDIPNKQDIITTTQTLVFTLEDGSEVSVEVYTKGA